MLKSLVLEDNLDQVLLSLMSAGASGDSVSGRDALRERDQMGRCPLHYARSLAMAELLVSHDALLNDRDIQGWTALHAAAANGFSDIVEFLVKEGAPVNSADSIGRSPLHLARNVETVRVLLEVLTTPGCGISCRSLVCMFAISNYGLLHAQRAFFLPVDVCLHVTCASCQRVRKHENVLTFFNFAYPQHGADVLSPAEDGDTPLHVLSLAGQSEAVQLVLSRGADPSRPNRALSRIPLHLAAETGDERTLQVRRTRTVPFARGTLPSLFFNDAIQHHVFTLPHEQVRT